MQFYNWNRLIKNCKEYDRNPKYAEVHLGIMEKLIEYTNEKKLMLGILKRIQIAIEADLKEDRLADQLITDELNGEE